MVLSEIKSVLGYTSLSFCKTNNPEWLRFWDNDNRVAVSIHVNTVELIESNSDTQLGLQKEIRSTDKGDYTAYRIVSYKEQPVAVL